MSQPDALSGINNELENIYMNLSQLQGTQVNAITKQGSMIDMVNKENSRLAAKKDTIDQASLHQSRGLYHNDNERKKNAAFLIIIISIVATLGAIFLIRVIFHHFGAYLPDMLFNILMMITISVGIIMILNQYMKIRGRDEYNFDELNLKTPMMELPNSTPSASSSGSLGAGCIGSQCCTPPIGDNPGTIWNSLIGKCVSSQMPTGSPAPSQTYIPSLSPVPSSNPTTMITSPVSTSNVQGFTTIQACDATEFNQYAPV
jgi:hypothetical protein